MNRRDFIAGLGTTAVLPLLPETTQAETGEYYPEFYGLWENEFWQISSPQDFEASVFITARTYNNERYPRILSVVTKPFQNGKKVIETVYLEPTSEEFPDIEEEV